MLQEYKSIPNIETIKKRGGYYLYDVIFQEKTFIPKLIDFTDYYDVLNLYPEREKAEIKDKTKKIKDFINWIDSKLE